MKKHGILAAVLTLAATLPVFGQNMHEQKAKTDTKQHDVASMMGRPTFEATVEGLQMRVWILTQKEHTKMMKGKMGQMMGKDMMGMKHEGMGIKDSSMGMGKGMMGMKDSSMGMGKSMMGMQHDGMGMNKAMRDSMMAGTHHIMLDVTDASSGKTIAGASVKLVIETPSKWNSSVDLKPMMSHFGGALTLKEKGEYRLTVNVIAENVSKATQFQYTVE